MSEGVCDCVCGCASSRAGIQSHKANNPLLLTLRPSVSHPGMELIIAATNTRAFTNCSSLVSSAACNKTKKKTRQEEVPVRGKRERVCAVRSPILLCLRSTHVARSTQLVSWQHRPEGCRQPQRERRQVKQRHSDRWPHLKRTAQAPVASLPPQLAAAWSSQRQKKLWYRASTWVRCECVRACVGVCVREKIMRGWWTQQLHAHILMVLTRGVCEAQLWGACKQTLFAHRSAKQTNKQ